jgi:cellulose synthase/poly-beta-1,6-N-acetylglucosamine synthase-like glycosyltransferase
MGDPTTRRPPIRAAVVVVPVHDEADELAGALTALAEAIETVDVPVAVTVVLDACSDDSASIPGADVGVCVVDARCVGAARRAGFAMHTAGDDIWFATTDADSRVPRDWLQRHVHLAALGADAVVGTVVPRDWEQWPGDAERLFDADYRARRRGGRHGHVHGANLGVRASAYTSVGGFPAVPADEDVGLVAALDAAGHAIKWDTDAPVATSTRRIGRAPAGFAGALAEIIELPGTA